MSKKRGNCGGGFPQVVSLGFLGAGGIIGINQPASPMSSSQSQMIIEDKYKENYKYKDNGNDNDTYKGKDRDRDKEKGE